MGSSSITSPKVAGGFTLVELLVGSFLGILLLFGVLQIFNSSREGARLQTAMAAVQDSGRIGIEFLSRDIRSADFAGCLNNRSDLFNGISDTSTGYEERVHRFYDITFGPLHGYQADASLQAVDFGGHTPVPGTSVLTIVTARPFCEGVASVGAELTTADQVVTTADTCVIPDNSPVLVTSCDSADIFIKTGGASPNIEHVAGVGAPQNVSAALSGLYGKDAGIFQPVVYKYFLAPGQNGTNALFRIENDTAFELVTNVEDFQITFGVKAANGSDLYFIDPLTKSAADIDAINYQDSVMARVLNVRVELQIASSELVDGQPLRRTYTATTNVRNRVDPS